jgi:hypothetical protein
MQYILSLDCKMDYGGNLVPASSYEFRLNDFDAVPWIEYV